MPKYSEIESPEILQELIHTRFDDRQKIRDLAKLEYYVKNGANSMAGNMQFQLLRTTYPDSFLDLLQAESPERYQAELQRQAEKRTADQQRAEQQALEEKKELQDWLAAGGLR